MSDLQTLFKAHFRYFYGQERGYFPIDAGIRDDNAPTGITMLIPTEDKPDIPNEREWCYYDPERPDLLDRAAAIALQKVEKYGNVYLTRTLFARKRATKDSAKPSRIIVVEDAPEALPVPASRVLRTSPQSRQAFYQLTEPVSTAKAEKLSKLIARVLSADKTGINANKVLRLVGGLNTKKKCGEPFRVSVESRGPEYTYDALWQAYSALLPAEALAEVEAQSQKDRTAIRWPEAKEQWVNYWLKHIDVLMDGKMPKVFKLVTQSQGYKIFGDDEYIAGWKHASGSWDASTVRWVRAMNLVRSGCTDEMAAAIIEAAEHPETIRIKGRNAVRNDIRNRVTTARETAVDRRGRRGYDLVGDFAGRHQSEYHIHADGQSQEINVGGRPTKLIADSLLVFYHEQASDGIITMTRAEVAAALHVSSETIYRLNSELKTRGEIAVELSDNRQRSIIRLARLVKTSAEIAPVTTRPDETPERIRAPQSEPSENAPARIVTHSLLRPALGDERATPPTPVRLAELRGWIREAFDAYPGRADIRKVRAHVAMLADGRAVDDLALVRFYKAERDKRRRDRGWHRLLDSLPTMPQGKLTRLSKRVDRILLGGADGPEADFYKWACQLQPYVSAELDRPERVAALDRRRKRRRGATVEESLLLAEIEPQRQPTRDDTNKVRSSQSPPAAAGPLTLAMDLSQAIYSSIGLADRVRQARDAYHERQAVTP